MFDAFFQCNEENNSEQILAMTIVVSLVASDFEFCVNGIVLFNQFDFMFINLIKYQVCSLSRYEVALLEANFSIKKTEFQRVSKGKNAFAEMPLFVEDLLAEHPFGWT